MILVTGGAGYIGSHTLIELLASNQQVLVLDNLCNSNTESLKRVKQITGKDITFIKGDVRDGQLLANLLACYPIESVIHFAGLKAVGESVQQPLNYYDNNVYGSQVLLQAMANAGVFNFIFSSSATVYGNPDVIPFSENTPTGTPTNPYGRSKLMVEQILADLAKSDARRNIALLRYFNPVGAHKSGLIGEDPNGVPNNLLPYIAQVAVGKLAKLAVFGDDYNTVDGTGVRDYIHVVDLAKGHIAALKFILANNGLHTWNLGTGNGYSVLQMVEAFELASGKKVPYSIAARREGDIAIYYADPKKAEQQLGWQAEQELDDMMSDTWHWQIQNPNGY